MSGQRGWNDDERGDGASAKCRMGRILVYLKVFYVNRLAPIERLKQSSLRDVAMGGSYQSNMGLPGNAGA